jgi:hypothetical protein
VLKSMTRAALSAAVLLTGLSAVLPALAQTPPPPPGVVIVPGAPPPVRVEVAPPPPPYPAVWRPGFWKWDGRGYRWVRGGYVRPPRARHEWVAGHWDGRPGGYVWVEGFWR